jgi:PAS domain S-box-containing protein
MFQLLFERSADAIWLFDPLAGVFVDCNLAAVELMRAGTKLKLLGARPEDLSPPFQPDGTTSRDKTAQVIAQVEERGSLRLEWRARRFDGNEIPLEVLLTPIDVAGRRLHVIVSRDITERKSTEAALRESEQKFRELFEASCDAIQILDPQERRIIDCNAATLRMAGGVDKAWFVSQPVGTLSPERQPDGTPSVSSRTVHATDDRAWTRRPAPHRSPTSSRVSQLLPHARQTWTVRVGCGARSTSSMPRLRPR